MRLFNYIAVVACMVASSYVGMAQPLEGADPHRTLLVPYPTAAEAAQRGMSRQRYMQPIEEWTEVDGMLRGEFTYPFSWVERQVLIRVEGVACPFEVYVNGRRAGVSNNGFAAVEFNITKISREDKNRVELRLLPADNVAAIECFAKGASRPVAYVISQPRVRVRDVAWKTNIEMGGVVNVDFSVVMQNQTLGEKSSRLYYELYLNDTVRLGAGHRDVVLGMHGVDTMRFGAPVPDSVLWRSTSPTRLSLRLKNRIAGRDVEFYDLPVALRELSYGEDGYVVNGAVEDVVWYDMSPCVGVEDVEAAYDRGVRAVRFGAGYVSDAVLDYCDARGLYVALTAPINSSLAGKSRRRGGNPSNNPSWCEEYVSRVAQMIHTTKRHASIVAYYIAEDSANGVCLYESYLAAKAISPVPVFYLDASGEWNTDDAH